MIKSSSTRLGLIVASGVALFFLPGCAILAGVGWSAIEAMAPGGGSDSANEKRLAEQYRAAVAKLPPEHRAAREEYQFSFPTSAGRGWGSRGVTSKGNLTRSTKEILASETEAAYRHYDAAFRKYGFSPTNSSGGGRVRKYRGGSVRVTVEVAPVSAESYQFYRQYNAKGRRPYRQEETRPRYPHLRIYGGEDASRTLRLTGSLRVVEKRSKKCQTCLV